MKAHYDPETQTVFLPPSATAFTRFHEEAHKDQHLSGSAVYRVWRVGRWIRGINYLVTLWIEFDANQRARRVMQKLGIWDESAKNEARQSLRSYVTRLELT